MSTVIIRPAANGSHIGLTPGAGKANWECVAADDGYECHCAANMYYYDLYTFTPTGLPASTVINRITLSAFVNQSNSTRYAYTKFCILEYANQSLPNSFYGTAGGTNTWALTTNPDTGNPWTVAELDALVAGIFLDNGGTGAAQAWWIAVEIDYIPMAAARRVPLIGPIW